MVLNRLLLVAALFGFGGAAVGASCGGEGPQPFLNLTLTSKVKKLGSVGAVRDFVFWERSNTIVYRNESNEVRVSRLNTGSDKSLSYSRYPLSRVVDPGERFLLAERAAYRLDMLDPSKWVDYWSGWGVSPRPLHWSGGQLRLTRMERSLLSWKIKVWDYNPHHDNWAKLRCEYVVGNRDWYYVDGAEHPYVYLYEVEEKRGDDYLNFYRMNTEDCSVVSVGTPSEPLPGDVERVFRFPEADALVAEVDHPTLNLRWQQGNRCRYHDIGNEKPLFTGNHHPVFATWNTGDGLTLYNLETQRMVKAVDAGELRDLKEKDLWLTDRNARLLFSPETAGDGRRLLLELEIDPLIPVR